MPKVNVKYFVNLRELMGVREEKYKVKEGTTLADLLLTHIPNRHPKVSERWKIQVFEIEGGEIKYERDGTPSLKYLVLINGISYASIREGKKRPGLRYKLKDGDNISIFPPVGGG
ncbi:molybdopterin synthase sulfur carrier subunit [Candidatus Bathyarchaeota archaeon]|nr:MAG: molybdopterin synthase sulfur carrier subunit [Candidatus Bathyarchaeota archaeon]